MPDNSAMTAKIMANGNASASARTPIGIIPAVVVVIVVLPSRWINTRADAGPTNSQARCHGPGVTPTRAAAASNTTPGWRLSVISAARPLQPSAQDLGDSNQDRSADTGENGRQPGKAMVRRSNDFECHEADTQDSEDRDDPLHR